VKHAVDLRRERMVGAFLILGTFGFFLLGLLSLSGGRALLAHQRYVLHLDHGTGLEPGIDVTVSGLRVGKVDAVSLTEDRMAELMLSVERRHAHFVRVDSVGRVSMTLTGKVVIIEPGTGVPLADGGSLIGGNHFDLIMALENMDLVGNLRRLEGILSEINTLMSQMKLGDGEYADAMTNLVHLINDLQSGHGTIGKLLKDDSMAVDIDEAIGTTANLVAQIESTATALTDMAPKIESAAGAIEGGVASLDEVSNSVAAATKDIGRVADDIGGTTKGLEGSILRLNASLDELGKTMKAIQNLPIVRGQVRKQEEEEQANQP
jgi:phospholipid/cholesterol/gamma-HCH transport system substrate-binding protein